MGTALLNLSGDLVDPLMLGLLHANDPDLEVEMEILELDDDWFDSPIVDDEAPERRPSLGDRILREALRLLIRRGRHER